MIEWGRGPNSTMLLSRVRWGERGPTSTMLLSRVRWGERGPTSTGLLAVLSEAGERGPTSTWLQDSVVSNEANEHICRIIPHKGNHVTAFLA